MKRLPIILFALFITLGLSAQDFPKGVWLTSEENTKIETYEKEGAWYGKIVSSDNPKAKIGKDILRGFKKENGQWNGKLFTAKRGKILDAVIEPQKEALNITVSAGFFTKSLVWKKKNNKFFL